MKKTLLPLFALLFLLPAVNACTWTTYTDENGKTALRQKYPAGTPVYYEDGTYQRNQRYNEYRPMQKTVTPARSAE